MGWVDPLLGSIVGLDTAPLIYYVEENPRYIALIDEFFEVLDAGDFDVVTSALTITEVLVRPLREGDAELADRYRETLLNASNITVVPVSLAIAERAADLRATYRLRTPDAVQLATALESDATFFLTNDLRLPEIPDLSMITLDSLSQ